MNEFYDLISNSIIEIMDQKANSGTDFKPYFRSNLCTDFFEVSINYQKLNEMFTKLNTIVTQQDIKILQLNHEIRDINRTFDQRIEKESQRNGMLYNKLENKINENFKQMNVCITDVNEKIQAKNRMIDKQISTVKSKIGKVEDYAK